MQDIVAQKQDIEGKVREHTEQKCGFRNFVR